VLSRLKSFAKSCRFCHFLPRKSESRPWAPGHPLGTGQATVIRPSALRAPRSSAKDQIPRETARRVVLQGNRRSTTRLLCPGPTLSPQATSWKLSRHNAESVRPSAPAGRPLGRGLHSAPDAATGCRPYAHSALGERAGPASGAKESSAPAGAPAGAPACGAATDPGSRAHGRGP
jgi:hypothetical protein